MQRFVWPYLYHDYLYHDSHISPPTIPVLSVIKTTYFDIPLPKDETVEGQFTTPQIGARPEGNRSITSDDKHLYILINGEQASRFALLRMEFFSPKGTVMDWAHHAKNMLKIDKKSGVAMHLKLKSPYRSVFFAGEELMGLSTMGKETRIEALKLN